MMAIEEWSNPDQVLASDACPEGCGAVFRNQFFHSQFPRFIKSRNIHINGLELLAITVALKAWGPELKGKRLQVFCDNEVSVHVINSGASRDPFLQNCIRETCFIAACHEFEIKSQTYCRR